MNDGMKFGLAISLLVPLTEVFAAGGLLPSRLNVTIGQTAVLHCNNTPGNTFIQWIRLNPSDDVPETSYTNRWEVSTGLIMRERIQLDASENGIKYNLHVLHTTTEDSGLYRCAFIRDQRPVTHDVFLIVYDPSEMFITDTATTDYNDYNFTNTTPFRTERGNKSGLTHTKLYVIIGIIGVVIIVSIVLTRCILTFKMRTELHSYENQSSQISPAEHFHIYDEPVAINSGQVSNNLHLNVNMEIPQTVCVSVEVTDQMPVVRNDNEESNGYNNPYEPLADGWSNYTHAYTGYQPQEKRNMVDVNQGDLPHVYDECGKEPNRPCNTYQSFMKHYDEPPHIYQ